MALDINTPNGQKSLEYERRAIQIVMRKHRGYYISTNKTLAADCDYLKANNDTLSSIIEVKCRDMKLTTLSNKFNNEWLVTADKIDKNCKLARSLKTQFFGILYLIPEDSVFLVWIYDGVNDKWKSTIEKRYTETQKTCNGGKAKRYNYYIKLDKSQYIVPVEQQSNEEWLREFEANLPQNKETQNATSNESA